MPKQLKHQPIQVGDTFGSWTVTGEAVMQKCKRGTRGTYPARCSCGYTALVPRQNLVSGLSTQCRSCSVRQVRKKDGIVRVAAMSAKSVIQFADKLTTDKLRSVQQAMTDEIAKRNAIAALCTSQETKQETPLPIPATGDRFGRKLPGKRTDWALFQELVRVHQSVNTSYAPINRDLYEWWATWNRLYFAETLAPLFIYTGNTDYGKFIGFCKYFPTREILIQQQGIKSPAKGNHHSEGVRQHEAFADLTIGQYCIALILLHEMIHQACFEAGLDPGHEGEPWAAHCNAIGSDLGLRLTYSAMKRGKLPAADGQTRVNVWKPIQPSLLPGTDRLATIDECRHFPWRADDPFIVANTVEVLKRETMKTVSVLPKF